LQLVLLDHGLYTTLSKEFRLQYCSLWKSIVTGDIEGIKKESKNMNAESVYQLFASVLTASTWDNITRAEFDTRTKPEHFEELREQTRDAAKDISHLLATIPRQLILLLKTNDCLRGVDFELGCPINSDIIRMRYCLRGLHQERLEQNWSIGTWARTRMEWYHMEFQICLFRFIFWFSTAVRNFFPVPVISPISSDFSWKNLNDYQDYFRSCLSLELRLRSEESFSRKSCFISNQTSFP